MKFFIILNKHQANNRLEHVIVLVLQVLKFRSENSPKIAYLQFHVLDSAQLWSMSRYHGTMVVAMTVKVHSNENLQENEGFSLRYNISRRTTYNIVS